MRRDAFRRKGDLSNPGLPNGYRLLGEGLVGRLAQLDGPLDRRRRQELVAELFEKFSAVVGEQSEAARSQPPAHPTM